MTRGDTDVTRIASSHAQLCGVATAVVPMSQRRMLRPGWAGRFSRAGKGQRATPRPAPTGLTFNKARIPSCPRCPGRGSRGRHPPTPPPTAARGPGDAAASASPDDSAVGGGSGSSPPHRCPRSGGGQATDTLRRLFPARAGHDPRLRGRRRAPRQARTHGLRPRCHPGPGPAQRRHLEVGRASSLAHPNAWQLCPSRSRSQTLWGHPGPLSFLHISRPSHLWVLLALPLNTPRVQPISLCPLLPSALEVPSSLPRGLPASALAHDSPLLLQPEQLRLHHVTMQDAPPAQGKRQRSRGPRSWSPCSPSCSLLP